MSEVDATILKLARDGLPYRAIQDTTGLSEGSVSWRIHNLRREGHVIPYRSYYVRRASCRTSTFTPAG
jgi:DNA-binding Lrp family transcriptional regulator